MIDISKSNTKSINYKDRKDNLIAKIAIDLTKNALIQENVKQRLELQSDIGNITPFVNGKSKVQFRLDKKRGKKYIELYQKLLLKKRIS